MHIIANVATPACQCGIETSSTQLRDYGVRQPFGAHANAAGAVDCEFVHDVSDLNFRNARDGHVQRVLHIAAAVLRVLVQVDTMQRDVVFITTKQRADDFSVQRLC